MPKVIILDERFNVIAGFVAMEAEDETVAATSRALRPLAADYIGWLEAGQPAEAAARHGAVPARATAEGAKLLKWLQAKTGALLDAGSNLASRAETR